MLKHWFSIEWWWQKQWWCWWQHQKYFWHLHCMHLVTQGSSIWIGYVNMWWLLFWFLGLFLQCSMWWLLGPLLGMFMWWLLHCFWESSCDGFSIVVGCCRRFEGGDTDGTCEGSCDDFCNGSSNRLSVGIWDGSCKGSWESCYNGSNFYNSSNQLAVMATTSCQYQHSSAASGQQTIIISR